MSYRTEYRGNRFRVQTTEPWYCTWGRYLCYTHLIVTVCLVPFMALGALFAALFTFGLSLLAFVGGLPLAFLPGFMGLWLLDIRGYAAKTANAPVASFDDN